jgi:hypothetical protein
MKLMMQPGELTIAAGAVLVFMIAVFPTTLTVPVDESPAAPIVLVSTPTTRKIDHGRRRAIIKRQVSYVSSYVWLGELRRAGHQH